MKNRVDRDSPREMEQFYFDVLKRITQYMRSEEVLRCAEKKYGLEPQEALEYAYDNIRGEAVAAIRGRKRPKLSLPAKPDKQKEVLG